ncbi:MAG: apolipoprotein N-acyltransferase [Alphaproteobacteria bacterium]|nr:apolipoprotein N-acyltransferase [Alphaproteobacteria bacterium]
MNETVFQRLARGARGLAGWRRALLAVVLGGAAALALPPFHIIPLLLPAFTGLVWLLEGAETSGHRRVRRSALVGFWFGLGHFFVGLHWIVEPMLVDPARTAWMIPFAWPGLSAALALFPAIVCGAVAIPRFGDRTWARVLTLAGAWTLVELLRGIVFTGFPWNLVGYSWAVSVPVMQVTAVLGIAGLGTLTVLMAAMPAVLGDSGATARRQGAVALLFALGLPALLWAGGAVRMSAGEMAVVPDVRLRLVQANIAQRDKWNPELRASHLARHVELSRSGDGPPPTHVIWPETAVPFLLANDPLVRIEASRAVPGGGALITGSVRTAFGAEGRRLYNAMLAIDGAANIAQVYDKTHLVPFGEYVPLRGVLPVEKVVPGQADFTPGRGRELMRIDGLPPVSPLICYEAIFPGRVTPDGARPGWLLNVTNDAWFGNFAGPRQHFAIASTRAVEEGLPLVRVANTGISAVIDPYGRVLARLGLGEAGVLDSVLPQALAPTPFARWGEAIPAALALVLLAAGLIAGRRRHTG